jgi:Transglutaminase-like superfamily
MSLLSKLWSLTRREKKILCEASIVLALANTCVKTISFAHIDRFLRTRWNGSTQGGIDRELEIRLIQRSISRAANVLPWNSLCLSRSIAEFIMLRRRGIPAVMFVGVRFSSQSSLDAHAWVDTGLESINKSAESSGFVNVIRIGTVAVDRGTHTL